MKFSENWLREWANPALDTEALVEQLSVSGLEVDTTEPVVMSRWLASPSAKWSRRSAPECGSAKTLHR